jgi:hypothetical protein
MQRTPISKWIDLYLVVVEAPIIAADHNQLFDFIALFDRFRCALTRR